MGITNILNYENKEKNCCVSIIIKSCLNAASRSLWFHYAVPKKLSSITY